jgi:hypothetical protein
LDWLVEMKKVRIVTYFGWLRRLIDIRLGSPSSTKRGCTKRNSKLGSWQGSIWPGLQDPRWTPR